QDVLAALPAKKSRQFRWAITTGAICLIGASLAWTMRIRDTRVQLEVTAASVSMRLAKDFTWSGTWRIGPAQVRLQHFTHLDLPPEYGTLDAVAREASLDLKAPDGNISLRHMFIGQGGLLTIARAETGATE